jgi:predicted permease
VSLLSVIVPIVLLVAAGYLLARSTAVETHSLSRVTIYLLTPSIVFTALVQTDLRMVGGYPLIGLIVVHYLLLLTLGGLGGRVLRLPKAERNGLMLATVLYNAGNYGLPVSLFAFGETGFRLATVIYVLAAIFTNSVGVFLASAGRRAALRALADVFRLPLIYSVILGLLFEQTGWPIPDPIWRPLVLMGQGAIPMLLITLGVQLAHAAPAGLTPALGLAMALRLVLSPLLTAALIPWFGITGTTAQVAVVCTAMPTAINAYLLAAEFENAPAFVASVVFLTTLVSFVTVSIALVLVR